jgi:deoxyribodipyrimidine photo-lyase
LVDSSVIGSPADLIRKNGTGGPKKIHSNESRKTGALSKDNESEERQFERWCQGMTGVPVVDAGMRQLLVEGILDNRMRMVVASYLTKHLRIHWRRGERHFERHLIDIDFSSNNGGWQWSASTGTDAQPYFRVFNPTSQSEKFTLDGSYIRRHVPELASLDTKDIHEPHLKLPREKFEKLAYPRPMIEHKEGRDKAIEMFASVKKRSE